LIGNSDALIKEKLGTYKLISKYLLLDHEESSGDRPHRD